MGLSYREVEIVKGMLERGDRQHDIAAFLGVNGGRIGEVAKGEGPYPEAKARDGGSLPPPGPYLTKCALQSVIQTFNHAIDAIELAEEANNMADVKAALELAKETLQAKIDDLDDFEEV